VRKLQSPKLSPSQFDPELVWTTRSVLDSAVDQIDAANRTPATKAKMAGLSDLEARFVCKACGKRGADVRPERAAGPRDGLPLMCGLIALDLARH
jgi:hypothetical protein